MRKSAVAVLMAVSLCACATHEAYLNPQFGPTTSAHHTVAILPFHVSISRVRLPKNLSAADVERMEHEEGLAVQTQLQTQLLRRAERYTVQFQDVARTNALLAQAGINADSLDAHTMDELAKVLNVDAVISGRIERSKPMATGTAIALGVLFGAAFMGNTNRVGVNLQIHNGQDGALLWTFAHQFGGSIGSNPENLANALMASIARRLPYRRAET